MDIRMIFDANPSKFKETAKDKSYEEFIRYLEDQPNFTIIRYFSETDKRLLYRLSKEEQR